MRAVTAEPAGRRRVVRPKTATLTASLRSHGLLGVLLLLVAAYFIAAFAGIGLLNALDPYPGDGLEHGALQEVGRVRLGQPLYVAPELGYVPFIYGPLYYALAAVVGALSGSDLFGLRFVSLLASLGTMGLIALLVRRESGSMGLGLAAGGVLAGSNQFVAGAMDNGRVDATAVFFLIAALFAAQHAIFEQRAGWRSGAAAGVLGALALLTKQSSLVVIISMLVVIGVLRRRQLAPSALGVVLTAAAGLALAGGSTWPWAWYYLWQLPRLHAVEPDFLMRFWGDVVAHLAIPLVVAPLFVFGRWLAGERGRVLFYLAFAAAMFGMSWITRSAYGGSQNVELPAYAIVAVLFGLGLHEALAQIGTASPRARHGRAYLLLAAAGSFAALMYNPRFEAPYRSDIWAGQRLSATLAQLPGPIFAGSFQGYLAQAPDAIAPDVAAVNEIWGEQVRPPTPEGEKWAGYFVDALRAGSVSYVVVDPENSAIIVPLLTTDYGYLDIGPLFPEGDAYWSWRTPHGPPKPEVYARPDLAGVPLPAPHGGGP